MGRSSNTSSMILSFCIFIVSTNLSAQLPSQFRFPDSIKSPFFTTGNICGNDMMLSRLRKDPGYRAKEEKMNREILNARRTLTAATVTLPVVVHIINQNPGSITDAQVINGINNLNDAFGKTGIYSGSLGADTKIRFCLAQKDPDGGNTTGITRTKSFFASHMNVEVEDTKLKDLVQWEPARYINIWLIESIDGEAYYDYRCGTWYRLGIGGYATMPPGEGSLDGIVVADLSVTLAHEMGHYLGLYHTFEGSCMNTDCQVNGDRVCDTPPDGSLRPSISCTSPDNSCNTDTLSNHSNGFFTTDVPDQISNFMDYGNASCSNQFTQGQADRMNATILTQRSGLLQDECSKPCAENIVAGFTRNIDYPKTGDLITFTNTSSGAASYQWLVDGTVVSTSANLTYTFSAIGKYKVTLKAYNIFTCFASYTDYVFVNCGVTARFYANKKTIASKISVYEDSVLFTNTSNNALTYQWLMSNTIGMSEQVISTNTNLTYVFPAPATYFVRLVASNGSCSDTSGLFSIPVKDPTPDGFPFINNILCYQQNKIKVSFCLANNGFASLPKNTPVTFYDADPGFPGAHKLFPEFYLPSDVAGSCGDCFTHILDASYRDIEKLYIVFNDSGNTVPVIFPNTPLAETQYLNNIQNNQSNRTIITASICAGENYTGHTTSGIYIDTLASVLNGCDSIRTLNLTVKPVISSSVSAEICQGDKFEGYTTSGTYVDIFKAANGCDSTRTLALIVKPLLVQNITASICEGITYTLPWGVIVKGSGTYRDTLRYIAGCDSLYRIVTLTVTPAPVLNISAAICAGKTYTLPWGQIVSSGGIYTDTVIASSGCYDPIRKVNLLVNPNPVIAITKSNDINCFIGISNLSATGGINYLWSPAGSLNNPNIKNPVALPTVTTTYAVQVTSLNKCTSTDSITVYVNKSDPGIGFALPSAFTPDDDGKNDCFGVKTWGYVTGLDLKIFNRWGQLVYSSNDPAKCWNGTFKGSKQATGVYVYLVSAETICGKIFRKGTVTLIR